MGLSMLGGLLGVLIGVTLVLLGRATARRASRPVERVMPTSGGRLSSQELYNFLNYDGGEMERPEAKREKKG